MTGNSADGEAKTAADIGKPMQPSSHGGRRWIAGHTHWGKAGIYYLCTEDEWDGQSRVNGHPVIHIVPCVLDPEIADAIVEHHNAGVGHVGGG